MSLPSRIETTKADNQQKVKGMPITIINETMPKSEINKLNNGQMVFDDANGILHIKTEKNCWKLSGFTKE